MGIIPCIMTTCDMKMYNKEKSSATIILQGGFTSISSQLIPCSRTNHRKHVFLKDRLPATPATPKVQGVLRKKWHVQVRIQCLLVTAFFSHDFEQYTTEGFFFKLPGSCTNSFLHVSQTRSVQSRHTVDKRCCVFKRKCDSECSLYSLQNLHF